LSTTDIEAVINAGRAIRIGKRMRKWIVEILEEFEKPNASITTWLDKDSIERWIKDNTNIGASNVECAIAK